MPTRFCRLISRRFLRPPWNDDERNFDKPPGHFPVVGCLAGNSGAGDLAPRQLRASYRRVSAIADRKSTRLNSSHQIISYAVFCLKKKKKQENLKKREQ